MWVADNSDEKIYAYNMRTRAHDPDKDFKIRKAVAGRPWGIWSDGTTMWVVDDWDYKICAYNMRSKDRDPKDCNRLPSGNTSPRGIWSDGTTMWVADNSDEKIYAYGGLGTTDQGIVSEQAIQAFQ